MSLFPQKEELNSAPGYSCPREMASAPLSPWRTALGEQRSTVLSGSLWHSQRRGSSCSCTIIAISGRATGTSAGTSIHGNRLPTGVARSLTLRADRKLMQPVLGYGAPAMPADTLSCLAQQIGACAALLPRFQQSVVTSRACDESHPTQPSRWSTLSTRTREVACAESCRAARQLLAATPPFLPPTARRTRSISIFSAFQKESGKTR